MFEALAAFSIFLVFTTVAPHLPGKHWLIRVWEFPRVQLIVLMLLALAGWAGLISLAGLSTPVVIFVGVLVACMLYQAFWIFPYTLLGGKEVSRIDKPSKARSISILNTNVYMHNTNYQGLLDLVDTHQPDIVVTLESNKDWEHALEPLHETYPHRIPCALENLYGMHLYSKKPFKQQELRYLVEDDVPSMIIELELDGEQVRLYMLHPKPPSPTENETAGPRDEELTLVGQEIAEQNIPIIVAGDLNDVAWSPTTRKFKKFSGARDPRCGRGFFNTFHAQHKLVRWPLDHVFHTDHFDLVDIKRLPGYGSDHFPLMITLHLTREAVHCESSSAPETDEKILPGN